MECRHIIHRGLRYCVGDFMSSTLTSWHCWPSRWYWEMGGRLEFPYTAMKMCCTYLLMRTRQREVWKGEKLKGIQQMVYD